MRVMLSKGTRRRPRPRSPSRLAPPPLVTRVTAIRVPSTSVKVAPKSRAGCPSSRPPPNPPIPMSPGLASAMASRHATTRWVECRMYPPSSSAEGARGARALLAARPERLYVLVQYKSQSLIEHVSATWRIGGRLPETFVTVVPPQMRGGETWYRGTADAVFQNLNLIRDFGPELVAVFGADHIYRMDLRHM